jgi:copper transport protein
VFSVGEAKLGSAQHAVEAGSLEGLRIALRVVRDFALLLAAGGVLCLFALGRFPHDRLVLVSAALVGAAAAVLGVGMQGAALLGDADALFSAAAWRTGLQSSFGSSACVATAGLLLVASTRRWLMLAGAIAALCSLPMTGHAQIAHPAAAAMFAVLVHGLAAAFWIGSLAGLWLSLRTQSVRAAALLRRFSPLGMAAVALLVAGAITLAVLQLRAPSDLATSAYGRFILAKSSLLALLIVLALINRYRLLPALERSAAGAARRLGFSIAAELVLLFLVIVVTATLVQTPPPERPHELTLESGGHTAALSVSPGRAGRNVISVRVPGAAEVTVEMANPAARIEPIVRPMARVSADDYRYQGTELAFAGTWAVTIHARIGDFEKRSFSVQLQIR